MLLPQMKEKLHKLFEMKDLGPLKYFLGLEVAFSSRGYLLSLFKCASDLIPLRDSERMLECEQIACLTGIGTLSALVRAVGISYRTSRPIRVH